MSSLEEIKHLNFVRKNHVTKTVVPPVDFEDRVRKVLEIYNQKDIDFNLLALPQRELKAAIDIIKKKTLNINNGQAFDQTFADLCQNSISDCLNKLFVIQSASSFFNERVFRANDPLAKQQIEFIDISNTLIHKFDTIVLSMQTLIKIIEELRASQATEIQNSIVLQMLINIFHESDTMLFAAFKVYFYLCNVSTKLIYIFDQYDYLTSQDSYRCFLKTHYSMHMKRYFQRKNLPDWQYPNPFPKIRSLIIEALSDIEEIINTIIIYKARCMEEFQSDKSKISNELFKRISSYLNRFYEIHKLKLEMVNNIEVVIRSNEHQKYNCYENTVVPSLIRDCHGHIMKKQKELRSSSPSKSKIGKDVIKAYKRSESILSAIPSFNFI